ncbi:unnamed protein product [Brassicogethes aeneus]|uniref:t-SNARE coiled-coil homology domain-containing protein n=1 Tax=Brassicogethes aeneus TaxID=1431903 RepID=A0A9P0FH93_BRAAE|nr:unnamed protein product [Brassicogethes aeneus]
MQTYKMATTAIQKQPFRIIEIPLTKFSDEVIPHHENALEQYKEQMRKIISLNDATQIKREIKDKKRAVKQLRDLMYELDTLRTQVDDPDLDKFDVKTLSMRKTLLKLITGYNEMEKLAERVIHPLGGEEDKENTEKNPFTNAKQIQLETSLETIKIQQAERTFNSVQNINQDVEDLHQMYEQLNSMVDTQSATVEEVEKIVENTVINIEEGTSFLKRAAKYKSVTYPVTGAFLGSIIGGPVGLLAGLKVGGAAALGCAIAGYTGGTYLKKATSAEAIEQDTVQNENTENEQNQIVIDKKDI